MKIIWYDAHTERWASQEPIFIVLPDTCLLLKNRPYYLPDDQATYRAQAALMVRIDRLGKHIEARFAKRYYDMVSVGFKIFDQSTLDQLRMASLPWEPAFCRDESIAINTWDSIDQWTQSPINFSHNDHSEPLQINTLTTQIDQAIETISKYVTLRTGDLFAIATNSISNSLRIGDLLTIHGSHPLSCSIK